MLYGQVGRVSAQCVAQMPSEHVSVCPIWHSLASSEEPVDLYQGCSAVLCSQVLLAGAQLGHEETSASVVRLMRVTALAERQGSV